MKSVYNFRDFCGLKAEDGRVVKKGLLFRSGMLDDAKEEDIEYLRALKLTYIFDFRDKNEVLKDEEYYKQLCKERFHLPASLRIEKIYKLQKNPSIRNALKRIYKEDVQEGYKMLPIENESYKRLLLAIKDNKAPILMHCSAGKDRAGIAAAIILKLLGIRYEDILIDYLKSLEIKEYIKERVGKMLPKILHKIIFKRFEPLLIVDKSFLDAAFSAIEEKYGDFDNYFLQEFGITKDDTDKIRSFYLE